MDSLLEQIRARITAGEPCDHPDEWLPVQAPTSLEFISAAEAELGFRVPDLLRQLYLDVGNGGFGPAFGLLPISFSSLGPNPPPEAEFDLVGSYKRLVSGFSDQEPGWPTGLVPVFYCGCTVFEMVDCLKTGHPVTYFDEGTEELDELFERKQQSDIPLSRRLESWLANEAIW